MGLSEQKTAGF